MLIQSMLRKTLFLLLLIFSACSSKAQESVQSIDDQETFMKLSGLPLSAKYGNIASIKVIYDLKTKQIYFINSGYYKYHFEFCQFKLKGTDDLNQFNVDNYDDSPNRDYLLGNVNYSKTLNKYFLDLSAFDQMPLHQIKQLYDEVKAHVFFKDNLYFLLNTARLLKEKEKLKKMFPILLPEEIYENISFQSVSKGKAYGKLRFVSNLDSLESPLLPTDVIVLNTTPMYLPLVAGIIVTEFQTPLSHLSILGQNRKIPVCAYKWAFKDQELLALDQKSVQFEVTGDTFLIVQKKHNFSSRPKQHIVLKKDLSVDSLLDIKYVSLKTADATGNKAANFGILNVLSKNGNFKVPEAGFAIPFYYYEQHVKNTKVAALIAKTSKFLENPDSLEIILDQIRKEIKKTKLDPFLVMNIQGKLQRSGYKTFRFRSSTNAEDAEGFSGAGLYESKTVILNDPEKTIENAILKVWASLWSYKAFMERAYFGIDHASVSMGILVHRSFPDEAVNGVAITKNIYRDGYEGFIVNAQLGDISVVEPPKGVTCDQFICSPKNLNSAFLNTVEVITFSSLNNKKLIMSESEIENLAEELEIIKRYFWPRVKNRPFSYEDFGLDVEFKLDKETRQLYIKQVRIYN